MARPIWTCPDCGDIVDALWGEDGEFHCTGLDCDRVVDSLLDSERATRGLPKKAFTAGLFEPKPPPPRASTDSEDSPGPQNCSDSPGPDCVLAIDPIPQDRDEAPEPRRPEVAKSRQGRCQDCKKTKWLLARTPPRCATCYRAIYPSKPKTKHKPAPLFKKPKKPKPIHEEVDGDAYRKPKRKKPKKRKPVEDASLTAETEAIEAVCRAIDPLDPQAIQRVLQFAVQRYSQTHGLPVSMQSMATYPALPPPA